MFSTSGDILNLVLAVCVAALTIFIVIAIYYIISSVQKAHRVIRRIENGVTQAEELLLLIKHKIKNGSAYLTVAAEVIKQAISFVNKKDWSSKKEGKKKAKK